MAPTTSLNYAVLCKYQLNRRNGVHCCVKEYMNKLIRYPGLIFVMVCPLLTIPIGTVNADETNSCTITCTDDLKECRKQADKATDLEAHPIITDSSVSRAYRNGQGGPLLSNNDLPQAQNEEIDKRRAERYQLCTNENNNCQHLCLPEPTSPKNSVILK